MTPDSKEEDRFERLQDIIRWDSLQHDVRRVLGGHDS
jgi:hypothetical protein